MGTETPAEPALWESARSGNAQAFADLFDSHRDQVFHQTLRSLRSPHDAEDVTAIVFLEAWRHRNRVRVVNGSILPWLLVTTNHVARNDDDGNQLWVRMVGPNSGTSTVEGLAVQPGSDARGLRTTLGQFLITTPTTVTAVDGLTGETLWTGDATGCNYTAQSTALFPAFEVPSADVLVVQATDQTVCRFDRRTGERRDAGTIPGGAYFVAGPQNVYGLTDGEVTASDSADGSVVWTRDSGASSVFFAGGQLVSVKGGVVSGF